MYSSLDHFFQSLLFYKEVKKTMMRSRWLTDQEKFGPTRVYYQRQN